MDDESAKAQASFKDRDFYKHASPPRRFRLPVETFIQMTKKLCLLQHRAPTPIRV